MRVPVFAAVKGISVALKGAVSQAAGILREGGTSTSININFDPTEMFQYSNVIIQCMMPVVYITAGLSLGFTVIYALKSAFSSRF